MKKFILVSLVVLLVSTLVFSQISIQKQKKPVLQVKPSVTVKFPNGGEKIKCGDSYKITWTSKNLTGLVKITLKSKTTGASWALGMADVEDGEKSCAIPAIIKGFHQAKILIAKPMTPIMDESNKTFTLLGKIKIIKPFRIKSISILYPKEGFSYYRNGRFMVMWKSTGGIKNIGIKLVWTYKNEPPLIYKLAENIPNTGNYIVEITPNIPAVNYYKLHVYDYNKPNIQDKRTVNIEIQ